MIEIDILECQWYVNGHFNIPGSHRLYVESQKTYDCLDIFYLILEFYSFNIKRIPDE